MKKLLCFIFCAMFLLSLCSCQQSAAPLTWSEETQAKIKRDYARFQNENYPNPNREDYTADDVTIDFYFGIYQGDAVALLISGMEVYSMMIVEEDIAGIHFSFGSSQILYIYHEGTFTPLKEAYEMGIVSKEDVREIHNRHERRGEYYYVGK